MGLSASEQQTSWAAIRSPVYWAVLGLVIERSGYGYELLKRFERAYEDTLPLSSNSHVYRALNVLHERGFVEEVHGPGSAGRQPKPHYRATREGVHAYRDWLITQARVAHQQSLVFARQLATFVREPQLGLEVIEHYERVCLADAQAGVARGVPVVRDARDPASLAAALQAEHARLALERELPWIRYAHAHFTALAEGKGIADEPA
jgi:DNA-binding PadR family transcriptional regulator